MFQLTFDIPNSLILLVAAIHILIIGVLVVSNKTISTPQRLFVLLEVSLIVWSFAMVLYRSTETVSAAFFWGQILYAAATAIPLIFLYFIHVFPEYRLNDFRLRDHILVSSVPVVVLFITLFDGILIRDVVLVPGAEKIIRFAPIPYALYSLYIMGYFSWSYAYLFSRLLRTSGNARIQIVFLLTGTLISTLIAVITNLVLLWFGIFDYNWVGQVAIVVMAVLIAYALARYNLLNAKVISAELFSGIIILILTTEFLFSENLAQFFINGVVLAITAILAFLLIRSVMTEVEAREKIEQLASEIQNANKELARINQAKSDFLSMASHQLKTPLSIIKGYISMALEGSFGRITKKIRSQLEKVYVSNERLISLVEDLLNLSRIEEGRMKYDWSNEDVVSLMGQVVEEMHMPAERKGLRIVWEPPREMLCVRIDLSKMRNVMFNLVDNAIKYTDKGTVTIAIAKYNQTVRVFITDTGRGVSSEQIKKLFTKFTRVLEGSKSLTTSGFGLGLYVARLIVEEHAGRIWAESAGLGKGSTFILELPLVASNPSHLSS